MDKQERSDAFDAVSRETNRSSALKYPEQEKVINGFIHDFQYELIRRCILENHVRLNSRQTHQIRPITIELGLLARTHA